MHFSFFSFLKGVAAIVGSPHRKVVGRINSGRSPACGGGVTIFMIDCFSVVAVVVLHRSELFFNNQFGGWLFD